MIHIKKIPLYIAKTIISSTALVLLLLIAIEVFIALAAEMRHVGQGDYTILQAIIYILLRLPQQVYMFFPMAGLLGSMIGLGTLATNSELVVMRAAGVSLAQIIRAVIFAALAMVFVMTIIGEAVAPKAMHRAESQKAIARSGGKALPTKAGTWVKEDENYIHIDSVLPGRRLKEVTRYRFDKAHHLLSISRAKTASYINDKWVLKDIVESDVKNTNVKTKHIDQQSWDIEINPAWLGKSSFVPDEMTMKKIYEYYHYLKDNGLESGSYELAFWKRLLQPLATCVMIFLAVPFVFGALRSTTMGLRILIGIILGFIFYILNAFFGPISLVYQFPPFLAAVIPMMLFTIAAFVLMRKAG